jgi:hypothetical protein
MVYWGSAFFYVLLWGLLVEDLYAVARVLGRLFGVGWGYQIGLWIWSLYLGV